MTFEGAPARREPRVEAAIEELRKLILSHYPTATFVVQPAPDDSATVHLVTTVDLDDPDEVVDLVIDRELELQVNEGIPLHVIPMRTPERLAALLHMQRRTNNPVVGPPHRR